MERGVAFSMWCAAKTTPNAPVPPKITIVSSVSGCEDGRGRDVGSSRGSRTTASAARRVAKAAYDAPRCFFQLFVDAFVSNARDTAAAAPTSRTSSRRRPNASRRRLAGVRRAAARLRSTTTSTTATFSNSDANDRAHPPSSDASLEKQISRETTRACAPATAHETFRDEPLDDERTNDGARVAFECERRRSVFRALVSVDGNVVAASIGSALADVASENVSSSTSSSTETRFMPVDRESMPTTETRFPRRCSLRASRSFREVPFPFPFTAPVANVRAPPANAALVDASNDAGTRSDSPRGESPRRHAAETDWKAASSTAGCTRHPSSGASSLEGAMTATNRSGEHERTVREWARMGAERASSIPRAGSFTPRAKSFARSFVPRARTCVRPVAPSTMCIVPSIACTRTWTHSPASAFAPSSANTNGASNATSRIASREDEHSRVDVEAIVACASSRNAAPGKSARPATR